MKTKTVLDACSSVFFPKPPTRSRKPRVNGRRKSFLSVSSARAVSPESGHASLPTSLEDWLVCKEALDICVKAKKVVGLSGA